MMLEIADEYPQYRENARKVQVVDTTAQAYYGSGYQDMQSRVPSIEKTQRDLGWTPTVDMRQALRHIFDYYADRVAAARDLASA